MKVWVDLANAPHVPFFLPIMTELQRRGHTIAVSMRDFNQTAELARLGGIDGAVIGTHGGKSSLRKMLNLMSRSRQLAAFGRAHGADVAVSHNSYTQTVAGRLIGARVVTIMDYEGQPANHIAFRFAHRVIVPDAFPQAHLRKFGCTDERVVRYDGFKEQVYLSGFRPRDSFLDELVRVCQLGSGWDPAKTTLVTVRAPASTATYHHFENALFDKLLCRLNQRPDLTVVLLPRTPDQRADYATRFPRLRIPSEALSGNDLVYFSDLVVSAGGTMNREAAVLGTPVYTIFAGELPAVDRKLIEMGRMTSIRSEEQLDRIPFCRREKLAPLENPDLCRRIADLVVAW